MSEATNTQLLQLTSTIVSSHLSNNRTDAGELPNLINSVYKSLADLGKDPAVVPEALVPAVAIKKSVFPDYIVCLEDGKKLKMLKRHIQTSYGLTPDAYRTKWGLPRDYPMVAPSYATIRSGLAKQIGLGRKTDDGKSAVKPIETPAAPAAKKPRASKAAA